MSRNEGIEIAPGAVFEFFESKEILCGVVLSVKDGRFNALSESNREVGLTFSRVVYSGKKSLDLELSRDQLLEKLRSISVNRKEIMNRIDMQAIWSLLESEDASYDAVEIAEFIFSTPVSDDQAAALKRLLLSDRLYFQAKDSRFYPRSAQNVETRRLELEKEAEREQKLIEGARWVASIYNRKQNITQIDFRDEITEELKNFALFGEDAKQSAFIKELLKLAGLASTSQSAFRILVRLGVWREDENLMLHEHGLSAEFPPDAVEQAERITISTLTQKAASEREDLTSLDVFTVDSPFTRDYDDALSVVELESGLFEVGIHIADVAELIEQGSPLDREAEARASSIYLPDERVSMLPASLSEGILSLKAQEDRLALSFLITIDSKADISKTRICKSVVRIRKQLTYGDVNDRVLEGGKFKALYDLAVKLRQKRLDRGAIVLPIPEIQVYVNSAGMIQISRYDKESPSQILVSEWMIEANAAAAVYLAQRDIPALYRSQAECRQETEFVQSEHELFSIYRRRRLFSRAELTTEPKPHCSLAIPNYTTVTSPIRRYSDLVVQRQLKHALAMDAELYSKQELDSLIAPLSLAHSRVFTIQRKWTRYWILKYMEQEDIDNLSALVLVKNARYAHLLIPDFLIEANAPVPENANFNQGEKVKIRIEKAIPREDVLKIQIVM
ncbi:Exoribonuclease II [Syntrophobacter sp. SbD1]|nr:Exoribonuclease II [Syntrophobacter sp. SbD1]